MRTSSKLVVAVFLLWIGAARAQPQEPPVAQPEEAGPVDTPPEEATADPVEELRREVASLREELHAQQSSEDGGDAGAEAEALAAAEELSQLATQESTHPVLLYGFMDVGYEKAFLDEHGLAAAGSQSTAGSFALGNLNLYLDVAPSPEWRAMIEVRFTNAPHGYQTLGFPGAPGMRIDHMALDYPSANSQGQVIIGGVVIERAWAEWTPRDEFHLRIGYFFTPWGIWNVDHGQPTLFGIGQPAFIQWQWFPSRQLGLEAYGTFNLGPWQLGYHAWVSNGRQPGLLDLTEDKSFGGRLYLLTHPTDYQLTIGVSGFWGSYLDRDRTLVGLTVEDTVTLHYDEWALGADLSLDVDAFRLRAEVVMRRLDYADDGPMIAPFLGRVPNHFDTSGFLVGAYRLPWLGLEPMLFFTFAHGPYLTGDTNLLMGAGLNIHFSPEVQLKIQYYYSDNRNLSQEGTIPASSAHALRGRLVVAF